MDVYLDTCDRIYLNELNLKKINKGTKAYKEILEQLEKDRKIKKEIESKIF